MHDEHDHTKATHNRCRASLPMPWTTSRPARRDGVAPTALLATLGATLLLAGCSPAVLRTMIGDTQTAATELLEEETGVRPRALVEVHDAPYLANTRVAHAQAAWLSERVTVKASELPFDRCLSKAFEQLTQVPSIAFAPDLDDRTVPVTLDHSGSFRDFLTLLADASGYGWEERGGALHWMANITRTFDVHRIPGTLSFSMNTVRSTQTAAIQTTGGGGGSGGSGGGGGGVRATPNSGGNIGLAATGRFWEDLQSTLVRLLGEDAETIIDRTTGTVVVRGPARLVRQAGQYIDALNQWLERQVLLEIQLVTVTLSDQNASGIDWALVRRAAGANPVGSSTFGDAAAKALGVAPGVFGIQFGPAPPGEAAEDLEGTSVILRALSTQGRTTVQKNPRVVALNGQATQLQVLNDRAILAGIDVITRETAALTTEVQLQPGVVSTGISVTILPKIVGERVFLYANILVSDLVRLDTAGTGDQTIQLPEVDRSQFFQSARLRSGETLALSGLLADKAASDRESLPRLGWMGTRRLESARTETVLLITPTLLDAPAPDEDLLL